MEIVLEVNQKGKAVVKKNMILNLNTVLEIKIRQKEVNKIVNKKMA